MQQEGLSVQRGFSNNLETGKKSLALQAVVTHSGAPIDECMGHFIEESLLIRMTLILPQYI